MFIKPAKRKYVKNCLLIASSFLGIIFVALFIFGLAVVRPNIIVQATNNAQYYLLDLNHLPQNLDTVEPDYIGHENNLGSKEFDMNIGASDEVSTTTNFANDNTPKIAILVTNLGLSKRINDLALQLPAQISLGVIPYSGSLQTFLNDAQGKGHEIYISLPNFVANGGEHHQSQEDERKFDDWINIYGKYKGIYSSHISVNDSHSFQHLLKQIEDKNLLFIIGSAQESGLLAKSSEHKNIIYPQIMIGLEADAHEIKKNLDQLVRQAKINKKALGYANGYLLTIEMINKWLPSLKLQGIELVPVSSLEGRQR